MMTKRERFMNFLASKPVDRVPVAFFHHFCDHKYFYNGFTNEAAFEENIIGHKYAREKFDPDVIKVMTDTLTYLPVDISCVKTAADLRKVHGDGLDSAFVKKSIELTKRVMAFYEDSDAPIYATGFAPSLVLRAAFRINCEEGEAKLRKFANEDPDALITALQTLTEEVSQFHELVFKECGVDGLYLSVNNQGGFFADDFFRQHVAPYDKKVLNNANKLSSINLLHICGYFGQSNNLELFTDFEAAAYNIAVHVEGVSLSEAKKLFGNKPVFGGYAKDTIIYNGSKEEVQKAAWDILDECGQIGIMLGADCTVPTDIDDSRLNWVRDAAIEYAKEKGTLSC